MSILIAILSAVPIVLTGGFLFDWLVPQTSRSWPEHIAISWLLGSGFVGLILFLISLVVVRLAVLSTIGITIVMSLAYVYRQRPYVRPNMFSMSHLWANWSHAILFFASSLLGALYALVAFSTQLGHDGLTIWGLKGKLVFLAGGWPPISELTRPFQWIFHLDYPRMIPSLEAWVYTFLGRVDEQAVKIIFILFFVALVTLFYSAMREWFPQLTALIVTLLMAATPYLASISALSGYVDVPLMSYTLAAFIFINRWLARNSADDLLIGTIMASLGIWVKREGMVYWLINVCILFIIILWWQRDTKWRYLRHLLIPAMLIAGPWLLFLQWHYFPNTDFVPLSLTVLAANSERLPLIANRLIRLWTAVGNWGVLWFLLALTLIKSGLNLRSFQTVYTWLYVLAVPLLLTLSLMLSTWGDGFSAHMNVSIDRLWLHVVPVAWYYIAMQNRGLDDWLQDMVAKTRVK